MSDYEKVEKLAADVATLLGITLVKIFDEEMIDPANFDKDDKTKGIGYEVVDPRHNLSMEMDYPLDISIAVDETFQFYHASSPYPTSLNTGDEARLMGQALIEAPTPIKDLTPEIYENFIQQNKETFSEDESNITII